MHTYSNKIRILSIIILALFCVEIAPEKWGLSHTSYCVAVGTVPIFYLTHSHIRAQAAGETGIAEAMGRDLGGQPKEASATGDLRSRTHAELEPYARKDMTRSQGIDKAGWFRQVIISNSSLDDLGSQYGVQEALNHCPPQVFY